MEQLRWWNGRGPRRLYPAGTRLRSHYRAQWTGDLVEARWNAYTLGGKQCGNWIIVVRVTHDRNGRPLRKPRVIHLDVGWLEVLGHDHNHDRGGEDHEEQDRRKGADDGR